MFTKPIYSTPLTGETPDRLFSNITASGALDQTFLTTMRILLHKRLPENERVHLICKSLYYSVNEIESVTEKQAMSWFIPGETQLKDSASKTHRIIIVYTLNQDTGTKMLEMVRAKFISEKRNSSGFSLQEDLRVFYARKCNALFYHNAVENMTVIFTDKLDYKQFHSLQMMLPKYLPSLFNENPLTELETDLLKSLGNKSAVEYEKLLHEFAKDLDIRAEIIRTKLTGFETAFERIRISELQNEIKAHEQNYENYLANLRDLSAKIQEKKYTLTGLECAISEHGGDSELMEYFQCNKDLSIMRVDGTLIEFVVHGYADVYDVEAFEQFVKNHGGFMYSNLNPAITKPQMEKLYRAIFSDCKYKLRLCAAYSADIRTKLNPKQYYNFPPESQTYFPNPHIQNLGCIGTYASKFQEYMRKRDYVGAINQATVSARNLNFYDSPVISTLAKNLSHSTISCIEKSDGTLLTVLEAIKELEGTSCQDQS